MELFNVIQFFPDDQYEYVRRNVSAEEAARAVAHYTISVGAKLGFTKRVIVTDMDDTICFEWQFSKGVVFPK